MKYIIDSCQSIRGIPAYFLCGCNIPSYPGKKISRLPEKGMTPIEKLRME
ncbi:MAG: hypothetical protein ACYDG2_04670 [Ruminiclostridium sp.]